MITRKSLTLFSLSLTAFILSACSVSEAPATQKDFAYVASISIDETQTVAYLEEMYGGKVLMHQASAGLAIMGFNQEEGELSTLSVEQNADLVSPEAHANGKSAWASGNSAWANGNSAWASGNSAWASGIGGETILDEGRPVLDVMNMTEALQAASNFGAGIKVAVIDTGFDLDHIIFSYNLAPKNEWKDFIDDDNYPNDDPKSDKKGKEGKMYGHGTAVGGIIAQIAPRATLLPIRVLNSDGAGQVSDIVLAIDWAVQHGADVINLSLGTNVDLVTMKALIEYASSQSVHIVIASGNAGKKGMDFPSAYAKLASNEDFVVSVGSTDKNKKRSKFSNYDTALEFLAPGEDIISAYPGNQLAAFSGTSFSTPIVSGLIALGLGELASPQELQSFLSGASETVTGADNGFGIPDALEFIEALRN